MAETAGARRKYGQGDYHKLAAAGLWDLGPILVKACQITAGQRVLDVAAGTGNVAIRAAEAGAKVIALDIAPEHFETGRLEAAARNVTVEWVEGDAQRLPFGDGEFDVVTSLFGAILAPNHQAVADELLRVCRPGGTIGMLNFTVTGAAADFLRVFAPYDPAPPPPGTPSSTLWGSEEYLRRLFGDRIASLHLEESLFVERAPNPREYCDFLKAVYGPALTIYESLQDEPERAAALDRDFLDFATRGNHGPPEGPAEYHYEYALVLARKRA